MASTALKMRRPEHRARNLLPAAVGYCEMDEASHPFHTTASSEFSHLESEPDVFFHADISSMEASLSCVGAAAVHPTPPHSNVEGNTP